jgi:hypothetical protein
MSASGLNLPTVAQIDFGHAGVLENAPPRCSNGCAKAVEILDGIELSLIPKSQCTGGFKRQWRLGEDIGLEAKATRSFRLRFEFLATRGVACIDVSVLRFEVAIDTELVNPATYLFDTATIGVGVELCMTDAKFIHQIPVNQRVLGGHFGG